MKTREMNLVRNAAKRLTGVVALVVAMQPFQANAIPQFFVGNGHAYEVVGGNYATWQAANAAATAMTFNGWTGHLATITSQAEQNFINTLGLSRDWIGGTQTGGANSNVFGWVTGETFT